MENNTYCVYKHTCKENGKMYVGISSNAPETRWNHGFGYQTNSVFWGEIVAYGWTNFEHMIIAENLSEQEARLIEDILVRELELTDSENGYNQNKGNIATYREMEAKTIPATNSERYGRRGHPVYFDGKVYLTIRAFAQDNGIDEVAAAQYLNPNVSLRMPQFLAEKNLRYATQEDIEQCSNQEI